MFKNPSPQNYDALARAFQAKIPEAELYLDKLVDEARTEAELFSKDPNGLYLLIEETRELSRR